MKIVIAGAGEVGSHVAKLLSREDQDITLIDTDASKLAVLDANYNLLTRRGSPTSFTVQKAAGVEKCDLFIAVTPHENTNVIACSIAKSLGAVKTVARIDNYEFMTGENRDFFARHGVNAMIYPEYLAAQEIVTALERSWVRNWFELHNGELIVVGVKIRENAHIAGIKLKELTMSNHYFHVSAIKRHHETLIPRGDDTLRPNDILYVTTTHEHVDELRTLCGKKHHEIRRVMIMGGSRIALRLIALAGDRYKFTIIESNRDRCQDLCERCDGTTIVHGDARDIDTLREEGIADADAFIALADEQRDKHSHLSDCQRMRSEENHSRGREHSADIGGGEPEYRYYSEQETVGIEQSVSNDDRRRCQFRPVYGTRRCRCCRDRGETACQSDQSTGERPETDTRYDYRRLDTRWQRHAG